MLSADAGSIPVIEGDRLIGMITDRDIAVRGVAKGHGPDTPGRTVGCCGITREELIGLRARSERET